MAKKVLLVESSTESVSTINHMLQRTGLTLCVANDGVSAFNQLRRDNFDLVVSDVSLPRMSGIDLLKKIKEIKAWLPVVLFSANARVRDAVEAMKLGAYDFMLKPFTYEMVKMVTSQIPAADNKTADANPKEKYKIVTDDAEMKRLLEEARCVAGSRASIFIQGESGTGKELFARFVHQHSDRRDNPFVAINCAALPETLLESELFGHEKGAFTGATMRKKGKFELANHGTILLDEISEMDFQLQSKLLRVLQEQEIDRLGGTLPIPIDVRVISTTNRDIETEIDAGRFREDLFYRLNIIPIDLPPLRERINDIGLLAEHFIQKYNQIENRNVKGLTQEALAALQQMPWKGNIRELENKIERATLICRNDIVEESDLVTGPGKKDECAGVQTDVPSGSLKELEQKAIYQTLDRTEGNRTHAAQILGISVRTLRNKLNEYREKMETA
jgi:two-component system response regulator FlrC